MRAGRPRSQCGGNTTCTGAWGIAIKPTLKLNGYRQMLQLDTSLLSGTRLRVSIFNPETGEMTSSYEIQNTGIHRVVPERNLDTFLVLES